MECAAERRSIRADSIWYDLWMRKFTNWAGTVVTAPSEWIVPEHEDALQDVVKRTIQRRGRIKVVGAAHSFSPIAAPVDVALSLHNICGIVSHDASKSEVVVRAGTRLKDLNAALAARGLALPIVGSIAEQAIAGAISTATHGSSLVHGNLASLVTAVQLVNGKGELLDIPSGDPRLPGARVHLGALGVLTSITLRVVPAFRLAEEIEQIPISEAIRNLEAIAHSAEYVKVWWIPRTQETQVYRYHRTDEPESTWPHPETLRFIDNKIGQDRLFPLFAAIQTQFPRTIPTINRWLAKTLLRPRLVGTSSLMLSTVMPARHRETEAAVPLSLASDAVSRVVHMIEKESYGANFPLEIRFVRGDDNWMSPAQGRDTCQIGAYTTQMHDTDAFFSSFWRTLKPLSPRPHFGKEHAYTVDDVRPLYPHVERFLALRDEIDPQRVFCSPHLRRLLG